MRTLEISILFLFFAWTAHTQNPQFSSLNKNLHTLNDDFEKVYNNSAAAFVQNSKGVLYAGAWGILRSTDDGISWDLINLPSDDGTRYSVYSITINSKDVMFATNGNDKLFRSTDEGLNWMELHADSTHTPFNCVMVNSEDILFIGTEYGLFRSYDDGDTYEELDWWGGVDNFPFVNPDRIIFARGNKIMRSSDNGASWTRCDDGLPHSGINAIVKNSRGHLIAGLPVRNGGVFFSTDTGMSWNPTAYSANSNSDSSVTRLVCTPADEIIVGTFSVGLLTLNNELDGVISYDIGLESDPKYGYPMISGLFITPAGHLLVGCDDGTYRSKHPISSVTETGSYLTESARVFPNPTFGYVNIYNESIGIKQIRIFNIKGQDIYESSFTKACHKLDLSSFQKGIYFIMVRSRNQVWTEKIIKL
jgi:photosystem II stability/assembly factor-like uncharacterized protein